MASVKNYYQLSQIEIDKIKRRGERPSLALHACCAPCSTFPLEFLTPVFDVTIIYSNSNIYPSSEYHLRLNELKRYIDIFNTKYQQNVKLVEFDYDNENFNKILEPLKDCKEGGERCKLCYALRLNEAYAYANNNKFDYFTTVMTISRQKNSQVLNEIGLKLSAKYETKYFFSDFKKKKGIDRSWELKKEYELYNQLYCGCKYSYNNYLNKIKDKTHES
jgi:predicted adenine nucleotide alpha hydrolase (AANH) superfamily ATPase